MNKLRLYLRLAHRWRWLSDGQYEHVSRMVAEVGRQPWIVHPPVTWNAEGTDLVTGETITTANLAREVGVSEAALYRHFASKAKKVLNTSLRSAIQATDCTCKGCNANKAATKPLRTIFPVNRQITQNSRNVLPVCNNTLVR